MSPPLITVIVPCRDESRYIDACLRSIAATTYPADRLEIIVADGMSTDGTRDRIAAAIAADPRITMIDNPALTSPVALNLGIARARGEIILRMDAHCEYPSDYIPTLVTALEEHKADNVGGVTVVQAAADTAVARAIALALAHPAGVGNSYFRIGTSAPKWVDTVPFGCWRRETFERIGLFDESLPRNQDDEFNMRLIRAGGRILLLPEVVTRYYARETLGQLWRMYYQYGFYKPLAARHSGARLRPRQLAPAAFVLSLAAGALLAPFTVLGAALLWLVAGFYALFVLWAVLPVTAQRGLATGLAFAGALPTMHFAYGAGFLHGALRFAILKRAPAAAAPKLSR